MAEKEKNLWVHNLSEMFACGKMQIRIVSKNYIVLCIIIGMDVVLAHYACTFENSNLHFHFKL